DDAADAAARLGISCSAWSAWRGSAEFSACTAAPAIEWEGLPAAITLICAGTRVEGVELLFEEPYERVLPVVERWLSFESSSPPLMVGWWRDEAVRLEPLGDRSLLTIAGPRFGKFYRGHLLGEGIADLATTLRN